MAAAKRSRVDISMKQKREICEYKDSYPQMSQDALSEHFSKKWQVQIARRTVGDILKRKECWSSVEGSVLRAKRLRRPKFQEVEEALALWFSTMQAKKAIVTDAILLGKGKMFAERLNCDEFTVSGGWLQRFKARHGICLRDLHGESASVNEDTVFTARLELKTILSAYDPKDIYNVDETGLFFRMPPSKSLTSGTKQFKDRITVALCTNVDGSDRIQPWIIGKSAKPRCFKDFVPSNYVHYVNNTKAWMTGHLFSEFLHHFDKHIKAKKNCPVLLLLDNVSSHHPDVDLQCVKLHYFPPNCTSHLQPLDAGIIRSCKAIYRQHQVKRLIELLEENKPADINLKEAIRYIAMAWKTITPSTIKNCWRHTGILQFPEENNDHEEDDSFQTLSVLLRRNEITRNDSMSADSFLDVDATVDTGEQPSEEDIIALVSNTDSTEESEDEEDGEPSAESVPTVQQAREAARILQRYFDSTSDVESSWTTSKLLNKLDIAATQGKTQTSLLSFLSTL